MNENVKKIIDAIKRDDVATVYTIISARSINAEELKKVIKYAENNNKERIIDAVLHNEIYMKEE